MNQDEDNELAQLRRAVLNDPRNAELRYLLAAAMAQQQDYDSAVLEFSAAVALNPMLHVARLQLGLLHLTLAQPHHTVAVLAPLEDLGDDAALKYFKRGLEALIRGDFGACLTNLRRGIELNHENEPLNRDMNLIIDKVVKLLADRDAAGQLAADPVRTDFSLYGTSTKH